MEPVGRRWQRKEAALRLRGRGTAHLHCALTALFAQPFVLQDLAIGAPASEPNSQGALTAEPVGDPPARHEQPIGFRATVDPYMLQQAPATPELESECADTPGGSLDPVQGEIQQLWDCLR